MSPNQKPVVDYFDAIAPVYDRLNRIISWGRDRRWRQEIAARLELNPGQTVLDVSAGTGDMEPVLKGVCPQLGVIGLDPSPGMLALYREKTPAATAALGTAEAIPLQDESVSRVVCTFGLRNFVDRGKAFREIHRVLTPGGLWGFLEMAAPRGLIFPVIYGLYFRRIVPLIGALMSPLPTAYQYLQKSVYAFPGYEVMLKEHRGAGFSLVYHRPILRGAVGLYIFRKE